MFIISSSSPASPSSPRVPVSTSEFPVSPVPLSSVPVTHFFLIAIRLALDGRFFFFDGRTVELPATAGSGLSTNVGSVPESATAAIVVLFCVDTNPNFFGAGSSRTLSKISTSFCFCFCCSCAVGLDRAGPTLMMISNADFRKGGMHDIDQY